jgi:micrococcal nuclease
MEKPVVIKKFPGNRWIKSWIQYSLCVSCTTVPLLLGAFWSSAGFSFGEPRIIPDTSFYFNNLQWGRYPSAVVAEVIDGNTILAQIEGELSVQVVRLAGIEKLTGSDQPFDQQAIDLMKSQILYRTVKLEGDKFARDEETSGPLEAYIWLEGVQMNGLLVRNGLATVVPYSHNIKYDNYFKGLQEQARAEKVGVWSL